MHPGVIAWWRAQRAAYGRGGCGNGGGPHGCGDHAEAGRHGHGPPGGGPSWGHHGGGGEGWGGDGDGGDGGGAFGVRRPLRFLAYKLDLDERQVSELATILDELKTERAQAEVDRRRTMSGFADAMSAEAFDEARALEAAGLRVASAERLRGAVVKALGRIFALLEPEQRRRFAYLVRTGALLL